MSVSGTPQPRSADDEQLAALGYQGEFERGMGMWSNMALGNTTPQDTIAEAERRVNELLANPPTN